MNRAKSIVRAFRLLSIAIVLAPTAYLVASNKEDSTSKTQSDKDSLTQQEKGRTPSAKKRREKQSVYSKKVNYWDLVKQESLRPPKIGEPKAAPHHIHPKRSKKQVIFDSTRIEKDTAQPKSEGPGETNPIDSIDDADTLKVSTTQRIKEPEPSVERKTGVSDQRVTESHWDVVKRESLAPARKKSKVMHRHPKFPFKVLDTTKNIKKIPSDSTQKNSKYPPDTLENKSNDSIPKLKKEEPSKF